MRPRRLHRFRPPEERSRVGAGLRLTLVLALNSSPSSLDVPPEASISGCLLVVLFFALSSRDRFADMPVEVLLWAVSLCRRLPVHRHQRGSTEPCSLSSIRLDGKLVRGMRPGERVLQGIATPAVNSHAPSPSCVPGSEASRGLLVRSRTRLPVGYTRQCTSRPGSGQVISRLNLLLDRQQFLFGRQEVDERFSRVALLCQCQAVYNAR